MRKTLIATIGAAAILATPVPLTAGPDADEPARDAEGNIIDRSHPDFLRCRTESVIGSRAKKRRICLTNSEWAKVARNGNRMATALIEGGQAGIDWEATQRAKTQRPCPQYVC